MNPVVEYSTVIPKKLFFWSAYDPVVKYECSCSAIVTKEGLLFIDPLPLTESAMAELLKEAEVRPVAILLTSGNHQRDSLSLAKKLSLPIYAPQEAQEEIQADRYFQPEGKLFGLQSLSLPGFALGETAFYDETGEEKMLILGDAITNGGPEGLLLLPKKYCEDQRLAMKSLEKIKTLVPTVLVTAHGLPVVTAVSAQLENLIGKLNN